MKRHICLLLLFVCLAATQALQGQNLIEQAKMIRPFFNPVSQAPGFYFSTANEDSLKVLTGRLAASLGIPGEVRLQDVLDRLSGNPFLGRESGSPKLMIDDSRQSTIKATGPRLSQIPPSGSSSFGVSTIADGIAKFLVTRAKQELSIAFFEKFQQRILEDKRLSTIFPETAKTLAAVGEKIYQTDNYLSDLRQSFDKDMQVLPSNFNIYCQTESLFSDTLYTGVLVEDLLNLSQRLLDKTPPNELIHFMATESALQQTGRLNMIRDETQRRQMQSIAGGLQVVELVSASLRSGDPLRIWIPRTELDQAVFDEATFFIYLGLLYEKGKNIRFNDKQTFGKLLGSLKKVDDVRTCFRNFCLYGEQIQQSIAMNRDQEVLADSLSGEMRYEPYYLFTNGLTGMLQAGLSLKMQSDSIRGLYSRTDTVFVQTLRHLSDLNFDVRQHMYASAINDVLLVLALVLPKDDKTQAFLSTLTKYGRFIANVAEAENSDEVAAAIEAIALPPGSSRLKKMSDFSVSLNAYMGGSFGWERLRTADRQSQLVAVSAPVGFAFNKGIGGRSYSLFVPVIDVGALAAFRLQDPDSEQLPELEWKNLFSPGLYFMWGFSKKYPLTLGFGVQNGPGLRKVTVDDIEIDDSAWRYGFLLNVDIPVFNLFSR